MACNGSLPLCCIEVIYLSALNEPLIGEYVGQICSKSVPVNGTALLLAVVLPTERCFMRPRVSEMKVKGFCNRVGPACTIKAVKPVTFFCSEH